MAPSVFTDAALNADRSNHGLWTAPPERPCMVCNSPPTPVMSAFPFDTPARKRSSSGFTMASAISSPSSITSCTDSCASDDRRSRHPGRRIAQIIRIKPECVEEYKKCHAQAWPEVLNAIRNSGIRDYHIYHDEKSNLLFATFLYIGYGFSDDMERMRENKRVQEWWKMTDGMQESLVEGAVGSAEGQWWKDVESVFYAA